MPSHEKHGYAGELHDVYQATFQSLDAANQMLQPLTKTIARSQFEIATFYAQQGQAYMAWWHAILMSRSPNQVAEANMALVRALSQQYAEFAPRLAGAVHHMVPPAQAADSHDLAAKRQHDTIQIPEHQRSGGHGAGNGAARPHEQR